MMSVILFICIGHWLALNVRKAVVNCKTLKEKSEVFYWWRSFCHWRGELEHRQIQNLVDVLQSEGLLPVVKVVCDWMKCNREVILTCAQVCHHASTCITCILFFFQTCVNFLSFENTGKYNMIYQTRYQMFRGICPNWIESGMQEIRKIMKKYNFGQNEQDS